MQRPNDSWFFAITIIFYMPANGVEINPSCDNA